MNDKPNSKNCSTKELKINEEVRKQYKKSIKTEVKRILREHKTSWLSVSVICRELVDRGFQIDKDLCQSCISELLDRNPEVWENKRNGDLVIGYCKEG